MNDNVTTLQTDLEKVRQGLRDLDRNTELFIEYGEKLAKIRKAHFDSYIEQGFTPEQALHLCRATTV